MHVVVIGGGLIGVTSAYYLLQDGHRVTLLERNPELAAECSFANGAMLHASHGEPWNSPAAVRQLLTWIGREDSPLLLRPARLPRLLGWGLRFLASSTPRRHREATLANTRLARYSQQLMAELRETVPLEYDQRRDGIAKIFHDRRELEAAERLSGMLEPLGVPFERWSARTLVEREPALADTESQLAGALYYPEDETGDPHRFTAALGEHCRARGLDLRTDTVVRSMERSGGRITAVLTESGRLAADAVVLAAGAEAPTLARPLGIRLPLEPVKGYSVTIDGTALSGLPRLPLIDDGHKVVMTPLGDRLRAAGTAEFTGVDTRVNGKRIELLLRQMGAALPGLRERLLAAPRTEWACLRAMTPDGPPMVGRSRLDNLWLNVGAGHMGWTFAAGMGRMLTDLMAGRSPDLDPAAYRPDRFS